MRRPFLIGSAAAAAALLAMPSFAVAQQNTYVNPDQSQMNPDQSSGQASTPRKRMHQSQTNSDEQTGNASKTHKRMHEAQTNSDQQAGETSKWRNQALATDNGERDRHGDRSRSRHGQFRYFHEGYYYATPWWTVGVPGVVVGNGGFDCGDGIRVAQRRGFNRVHPVDCGGDFYRYEGWRGGEPWRIRIDADTGQIISVRPAG
jgi:hypothetical protein